MKRKIKDWSKYGHCPTCEVGRGEPCIDRRYLVDAFVGPTPMLRAHSNRERLFRRLKDEERTSN